LIFACEGDSIGELIGKLESAAELRVGGFTGGNGTLFKNGNALDPRLTVSAAGFRALDKFEVRRDV